MNTPSPKAVVKLMIQNNLAIELVFVHPSKAPTNNLESIITSNMVSEFKAVTSESLEELLNEGAHGAVGKYLLFIPVLASQRYLTLFDTLNINNTNTKIKTTYH